MCGCAACYMHAGGNDAVAHAVGNARFQINGRSAANAEAFAIANSVVAAAVGVDVCGQCEVAAGLFARSFEAIYIEATAEAEIALSGASTPDAPVEARASAFRAQLVTATAEAIADVRPNPTLNRQGT